MACYKKPHSIGRLSDNVKKAKIIPCGKYKCVCCKKLLVRSSYSLTNGINFVPTSFSKFLTIGCLDSKVIYFILNENFEVLNVFYCCNTLAEEADRPELHNVRIFPIILLDYNDGEFILMKMAEIIRYILINIPN